MTPLFFSQLLSSRICHDLIAPAGAIMSGLELLEESGPTFEGQQDLFNVVQKSAETLTKKLVFYRTAFGSSSASRFHSFEDISTFLGEYLATTSLKFAYLEKEPFAQEVDYADMGRLMCNVVLFLMESAPRGGELVICSQADSLVFMLSGHLVALKEKNKKAMEGMLEESEITAHVIQPYLTSMMVEKMGCCLSFEEESLQKITFKMALFGQERKTLFG